MLVGQKKQYQVCQKPADLPQRISFGDLMVQPGVVLIGYRGPVSIVVKTFFTFFILVTFLRFLFMYVFKIKNVENLLTHRS